VYDTAVSHALLRQVAAGACPETLRLYVPDEVALFSILDRRNPGFAGATSAAQARGCPSLLRLAGGSAALFHRHCLAFAWAIPDTRSAEGITARFEAITAIMQRALERVGVDARIGAVAGEYCPGDYSINGGGRIKLLGVGQRVIRGAAHVGGVLVVRDAARVREVLSPVYHALGQTFDPATVGAVEDCVPGVSLEEVARAIRAEFAALRGLVESEVGAATRDLAAELEVTHSVRAL
jgi:lipoate-protein ligase A